MSIRSKRKLKETLQLLNIIEKNPNLVENQALVHEIIDSMPKDYFEKNDFEFVSVSDNSPQVESKNTIDEICKKVKNEVLEQVRSDISSLVNAVNKEASTDEMTRALSDSIRSISGIPQVKKIYASIEPNNLYMIVIHKSTDRIGILRKVVEVQNLLDVKFDRVYFDFKILHESELRDNQTLSTSIVFERD